jgi:hypothetical protein
LRDEERRKQKVRERHVHVNYHAVSHQSFSDASRTPSKDNYK